MYLQIGTSVVVPQREILGIYDLDNASWSHITRAFLARAEKEGRVISAGDDLPKSFLVCRSPTGETKIYLSQLSPATLLKRAESTQFEIK